LKHKKHKKTKLYFLGKEREKKGKKNREKLTSDKPPYLYQHTSYYEKDDVTMLSTTL
jgi:hypothetical protein